MTQISSSTPDKAAMPAEHSDLVGGSSAAKRLACPGSYQMEQKLPKELKESSSSYADEGSACHAAMAHILENDIVLTNRVLGMTFEKFEAYPMTPALIRDAIKPCMDFFDELCDEAEAEGGLRFIVEKQCQLPGIPGAFGTSDLSGRTDKRSVILDWKFGAGVPVYAYYEEELGDDDKTVVTKPNEQLCFYARAAMHSFPEMFERDNPDWPVELIIAQPRLREGPVFDRYTVTVRQLEQFRIQLIAAVSEATGSQPRIRRGEHCRFAKCKAICPKFTGPVLDLTKLHDKLHTKRAHVTDWSDTFADMLLIADLVEPVIKEWREQAHVFMEAGGAVPGRKLVAKRAQEKYHDEDGARRMAIAKGVGLDDVWAPREMKSPAQLRETLADRMEAKTKKAREELAKAEIAKFTTKVSSGTTIAPEDDRREGVISAGDVMASLGNKLAALQ